MNLPARTGEEITLGAATFNRLMQAEAAIRQIQRGGHGRSLQTFKQTGLVKIKNNGAGLETDINCPRFGVLGIEAPLISFDDSENQFSQEVRLLGRRPQEAHRGQFVIAQEPIPGPVFDAGQEPPIEVSGGHIGRACIDGVTIANIEIRAEHHRFADVIPGNIEKLGSAEGGAAEILVIPPPAAPPVYPYTGLGVVRLGHRTGLTWFRLIGAPPYATWTPADPPYGTLPSNNVLVGVPVGTEYIVGNSVQLLPTSMRLAFNSGRVDLSEAVPVVNASTYVPAYYGKIPAGSPVSNPGLVWEGWIVPNQFSPADRVT